MQTIDVFQPHYYVREIVQGQGLATFWFTDAEAAQDELRKAQNSGVLFDFGRRTMMSHKNVGIPSAR